VRLSDHFDVQEFECMDGTPVPPELIVNARALCALVLEPLRRAWAGPIIVVSGYRTPAWNQGVHGAAASTHLTAEGADVRPVHRGGVRNLHAMALDLRLRGELPDLGGLGLYPGWVHLDIRKAPDGHLRRWTGKGVGSEP
jgi:uncharacterized protein YcbK (DUF882 family)